MANVLMRRIRTNTIESGKIVESMLFGNNTSFSLRQAVFINNKNNYNCTKENFQQNILKFIQRYPNSKYYTLKGRAESKTYQKGNCLFRWNSK